MPYSVAMLRRTLAILTPILLFLGGCSNPWRDNFVANPAFRDVEFPPTKSVIIRRVEPERLAEYYKAAHERALKSDVAPDEWPEAKRLQEKQEFLKTLRISEGPEAIVFLGSSSFMNAGTIDLYNGQLQSVAEKIGADYAVVSEEYVGLRDQIVYSPVTTYGWGWGGGWGGHYGRWGPWRSDFDFYTTYVPMVVSMDSYHYVAFFLRKTTPGEYEHLRETYWVN